MSGKKGMPQPQLPPDAVVIETESLWFKVAVLVISALLIVFFAWNTWVYYKLKSTKLSPIHDEDATTMLVFNIIMLILSIVIFAWALWRIVLANKYREDLQKRVTSKTAQFLQSKETGYAPVQAVTTSGVPVVPVTSKPANVVVAAAKPATTAPAAFQPSKTITVPTSRNVAFAPSAGTVRVKVPQ